MTDSTEADIGSAIPADYFDAFIAKQLANPKPDDEADHVVVHAYED